MTENAQWRPTISPSHCKARAEIIRAIREFFYQHDVTEVETPVLSHYGVTDPHIVNMTCEYPNPQKTLYLQTSPEYPMKRLLVAGSGSIYQMCKSFRVDEQGRYHNPEFTMLEWYRVDYDHHQLMNDMDDLLTCVLNTPSAIRKTYQTVFKEHLDICPLSASLEALQAVAKPFNPPVLGDNKDDWLLFLFSHAVEPNLQVLTFVYDFPATQAALARVNTDNPNVCDRFEVYFKGIELANGFHELSDAKEQRRRFESDNQQATQPMAMDENFLQALEHGLPDCAGVALGVDRLVMLALGVERIEEVLSFSFANA